MSSSTPPPTTLKVAAISYEPARNYSHELGSVAESAFRCIFPRMMADLIPPMDWSVPSCPLYRVEFKAHSNQITSILSNSAKERRTLVSLLASRWKFGYFDGDVTIEGLKLQGTFQDNVAFVPMVSVVSVKVRV